MSDALKLEDDLLEIMERIHIETSFKDRTIKGHRFKKLLGFVSPSFDSASRHTAPPPDTIAVRPYVDEGELETVMNQHSGPNQPRSGPLYRERTGFMEREMEREMYGEERYREHSPSFTDKETQDDLREGRLPVSVHETYRLISSDDPAARDFQAKMTAITQRLFKGNYGAKLHGFRFMISDEKDPTACVLYKAKPPIMVFSKGLLESFETEDELAAATAHELAHQNIFDRIGDHPNSNPEEASGDIWAVHLLQEAVYNPQATLSTLEKAHPDRRFRRRKTALEAYEVHPSYHTRRRDVEDALAYLESKKPLNTELTPLDPALKMAVAATHHQAFVPGFLDRSQYETLAAEDKIAVLCSLWDDDLSQRSFDQYMTRLDDFEKEVKSLAATLKDNPRLLDPLLMRILTLQEDHYFLVRQDRAESLYRAVNAAYGHHHDKEYGYTPLGPLKDLQTAMACFIKAETREDAQAHAEVINAIAGQFDFSNSLIFPYIRWPDFEIKFITELDKKIQAGELVALPWNKLKKWSAGSPEIQQALARFQVNGVGLPEVEKKDRIIPREIEWLRHGYDPQKHLSFDADGNITGHNIKRIKRETPRWERFSGTDDDEPYLQARDRDADEILKRVDWQSMEDDFTEFISRYRNQLTPQITTAKGGDRFQAAFCEKCRDLLQRNPEKYRPMLTAFFSEQKTSENGQEKEKKNISFYSLLDEFTEQYRVFPSKRAIGGSRAGKQYGLSTDAPYLSFMLHDLGLPIVDRFALLSQSRWRKERGSEQPEDFIDFDFRSVFQYKKPESAEELYKTIAYLNEISQNDDKKYGRDHSQERTLRAYLINTEIYAYLTLKKNETLDIKNLSDLCGQNTESANDFFQKDFVLSFQPNELVPDDEKKKHTNIYARLLDRQIEYLFDASALEEKTPEELVRDYQILCFGSAERPSFLDRKPKEKSKYESLLRNRISALDDVITKKRLTESLLCSDHLKDPDFRAWASGEWMRSQGRIIKDDPHANIEAIADNIIKNAKMGQSVEMLNGLLEEIEAQEDVSYMVRDKLANHFLKTGTKGNLVAAANDYVLERIGDEPKIRDDLLEFLTSPLTDDTISVFLAAMKGPKIAYYAKGIFYIFKNQIDERGVEIPDDMRVNALRNIYKNFWALPFAARTLYIERVLFPIGEDSDAQFARAVSYAVDKILPRGQPYMDQARLILETHLEQCSKPLQRLVFSALITANEKRDQADAKLRPGQVLSQVLGRSGAAGGKILQAIHSYLQSLPEPDEDLVQLIADLQSSKSNYNKPFRWDIIRRFKDCYKPRSDRPVPTVGRQLGAGSYGYTVELVYPGAVNALTMAREDVAQESNYQFGLFKRTAEKLSQINRIWEPLINILSNAKKMSAVESDFEIAAVQIKAAEKLYNGLSVSANGYDFNISTAALQHFGKDFKETELAHGEHFLDLPTVTEEQRKYRRAVAKAILTVEIHCWMKGGPFDYDRHGAQCRVKGNTIKLFDHGSIPYDIEKRRIIIPTVQDKLLLGRIIAESYAESKNSHGSLNEILVAKLTQTDSYGDSKDYIECFKRGILALSDYMKDVADTPEERNRIIKEAILQSVKTGLADEAIVRSILENVESADLQKDTTLEKTAIVLHDKNSSLGKRLLSGLSLSFSKSLLGSWYHHGQTAWSGKSPASGWENRPYTNGPNF